MASSLGLRTHLSCTFCYRVPIKAGSFAAEPSKLAFYDESAWEMNKTGMPGMGLGPVGERILRHARYEVRRVHSAGVGR